MKKSALNSSVRVSGVKPHQPTGIRHGGGGGQSANGCNSSCGVCCGRVVIRPKQK